MKKFLAILVMSLLMIVSTGSIVNAAKPAPTTIVDVAIAVNTEGPYEGYFDTLIAAVLAADPAVLKTLSGRGQFTVFAPTDDAFAALGLDPSNIASLGQANLTKILLYHVAKGRRDAEAVVDSSRIRTLQGSFLMQSGGILTDKLGRDANIIVTDVPATNGIIHVIDSVLLPFAP